MPSDWCELNNDVVRVVRQQTTHIRNAIDKNGYDLRIMVGPHGWHTFCDKKFCLLNLDAMSLHHDCFRRSYHSRRCNLRV